MQRLINNEHEYEVSLIRIYTLMQTDIKPHFEQSDEFENLSILVNDYENTNYPIPKPTHH